MSLVNVIPSNRNRKAPKTRGTIVLRLYLKIFFTRPVVFSTINNNVLETKMNRKFTPKKKLTGLLHRSGI